MSQQMRQLIKILRSRRGHILSVILHADKSDVTLIGAFRERFLRPRRAKAYSTLRRGMVHQRATRKSRLGPGARHAIRRHLYALPGRAWTRLTPELADELCALVLDGAVRRQSGRLRGNAC